MDMPAFLYVAFILLCIGIVVLCKLPSLAKEYRLYRKNKVSTVRPNDYYYIEGKEMSAAEKYINKQKQIVKDAGMPIMIFVAFMAVSVVAGFFFGKFIFNDGLLAMAVALAFLFLPSIYLESEISRLKLIEMQKIESSMSIITNAYIVNNDIVAAIKNNLDLLAYKKPFEEFLVEVTYFDSSVTNALQHMASKQTNKFFIQWIDTLILTQTDRKMVYILSIIVEQMNEQRREQIEANTAMTTVWLDYLTLLGIVISFPLIFKFVLYDWYEILVTTKIGKGLMMGLILTVLLSLKKATTINKPIEL